MNSVGIDVSKGKSMIAVMRPFREIVVTPYEVSHTDSELSELAKLLKSLFINIECTGRIYCTPLEAPLSSFYIYRQRKQSK